MWSGDVGGVDWGGVNADVECCCVVGSRGRRRGEEDGGKLSSSVMGSAKL